MGENLRSCRQNVQFRYRFMTLQQFLMKICSIALQSKDTKFCINRSKSRTNDMKARSKCGRSTSSLISCFSILVYEMEKITAQWEDSDPTNSE